MGVVLVIMRILCILFNSLLLNHSQPPSTYRNKDMEISRESVETTERFNRRGGGGGGGDIYIFDSAEISRQLVRQNRKKLLSPLLITALVSPLWPAHKELQVSQPQIL